MSYLFQKSKSFRKKSLGDLTIMDTSVPCNRTFLMEAPCAMSPAQIPMTAKPRHLFLFSDLLLVAKPRSGGNFKLKVSKNQILSFHQVLGHLLCLILNFLIFSVMCIYFLFPTLTNIQCLQKVNEGHLQRCQPLNDIITSKLF